MAEQEMYIVKVNVLIKSKENLILESEIDTILDCFLSNTSGERVSTNIIDISGDNYGQCSQCGCWCSDPQKDNFVHEFSVGCVENGTWCCDLCLPKDHLYSF